MPSDALTPTALPPHRLRVALFQPQIAPNTGNIGRLCVAAGAELHLVRPLGFVLSDRNLKRSAMDYWPRLKFTVHDDANFFRLAQSEACPPSRSLDGDSGVGCRANSVPVTQASRMWFFSSRAMRCLWDADFVASDWLVFGSETRGLSDEVLSRHADHAVRIPQAAGERCLNLATAAGIGLYEAIRQIDRRDSG